VAIRNLHRIGKARLDATERIATMDVRTARMHMVFGILLSAGLGLSAVL